MSGEPTDADVIRSAIDSRLLSLHTSMPGVVATYNPATQTGEVQPVIKRAVPTSSDGLEHETLPIIHNVPIECPMGGGGFATQFPILPGEHVWLIFSEAATARWRSTGQISEPGDLRRHDLSYAMALVVRGTVTKVLTPLVPPTEARMDCPAPFVFGSQVAAQFVANATLVTAQLAALKAAIEAAPVVATDGGLSFKTALVAALASWPATVAATKLKAE